MSLFRATSRAHFSGSAAVVAAAINVQRIISTILVILTTYNLTILILDSASVEARLIAGITIRLTHAQCLGAVRLAIGILRVTVGQCSRIRRTTACRAAATLNTPIAVHYYARLLLRLCRRREGRDCQY